MKETIVIIGAGAAGLLAARELSAAGRAVVLLEGSERTGGRIHTVTAPGFEQPVELGAEFVHGWLPLTMELLKEAGIGYEKTSGRMVRVRKGQWQEQEEFTINWDLLMERMHRLPADMPLAVFLNDYFGGEEYAGLRASVQRFAEGFDVADINDVSTFSLREEWSHEEEGQYRVKGGYGSLIHFLEQQCLDRGVVVRTSCIVNEISWSAGAVRVLCANGEVFTGHKVLITAPAGVLKAGPGEPAAIRLSPAVEAYTTAARQVGYGTVTKFLLQFTTPFWNSYAKNIGFVIGDATIPTWWTQDGQSCLLTGWLGGPKAAALQEMDAEGLLREALRSLAVIFDKPEAELRQSLLAWKVADWAKDPFSRGAYSYDTVHTAAARQRLRTPVENTLFWAGEALYEGVSPGTVEAAFTSGKQAAQRMLF